MNTIDIAETKPEQSADSLTPQSAASSISSLSSTMRERTSCFLNARDIEGKRYVILRPSGNDTCLVEGIVLNPDLRRIINDGIMRRYPNVEQTGFVCTEPNRYELLMAGGEFCGNATRCAAYLALDGKEGEITIRVSGAKRSLRAGVTKDGDAWSEMPIESDMSSVQEKSDGTFVVQLDGITHIVDCRETNFAGKTPEELKESAMLMLRERKLDTLPASGVMFVERRGDRIFMQPVVFVSGIQTLFYESACGSGTTAVGMVLSARQRTSLEASIIQPSNMPIRVCVEVVNNKFTSARIQGPIEILDQ